MTVDDVLTYLLRLTLCRWGWHPFTVRRAVLDGHESWVRVPCIPIPIRSRTMIKMHIICRACGLDMGREQ
jgi:hypothetical protein